MLDDAIRGAADPEAARRFLEQLLEAPTVQAAALSGDELGRLGRFAGICRSLSRWLLRHPSRAAEIARRSDEDLRPAAVHSRVDAAVRASLEAGDRAAFDTELRMARHSEMSVIAMSELAGEAPLTQHFEALSALADACLDRAYEFHRRRACRKLELPEDAGHRSVVIALGKLGAQELNFCSDVDIVVVYDRDPRISAAADQALHARITEGLAASLGKPTEDGFVFRVDLDLRPEGRSGPLVNSLDATEAYYEAYGRTWERMALGKARRATGSQEVMAQFERMLRAFIHPRYLDESAIDEVGEMKANVERTRQRQREGLEGTALPWDVKLDPGGLRDIEFVVGAHQLLGGGQRPKLRVRGTLPGLGVLAEVGLLGRQREQQLREAYLFLRRLEHRLQMIDERQTQLVPDDDDVLRLIARSMGLEGASELRSALATHQSVVREAFSAHFPNATPEPPGPAGALLAAVALEDAEARKQALAAVGFGKEALQTIERLARRPNSGLSAQASSQAQRTAAAVLSEALETPDPGAALRQLEALLRVRGQHAGLWRMLGEQPRTRAALMSLFGGSEMLSRLFLGHPELMDRLLLAGRAQVRRSHQELEAELNARLAAAQERDPRTEVGLAEVVRFKNQETLRIGLSDITGALDLQEVVVQLSDLAQVILGACLELAREELRPRFGQPYQADGEKLAALTVLGLGKLGGREMGYRSDLDLVFVYAGQGQTRGGRRDPIGLGEYFSRLVQKLIALLQCRVAEGSLYEVDTALRPSGSQGVLVVSRDAFLRYHQKEAQTWERQSLLRMRPVAGDPALGEELREVVEQVVYRPGQNPGPEIAQMRERMASERARGQRYHVKLGRGGITDIEFTAQVLQLRYGAQHPQLRWVGTREVLGRAVDLELLSAEDGAFLLEAHTFLRTLENRLRIVHNVSMEALPADAGPGTDSAPNLALDGVARRMRLPHGGALLQRYLSLTEGVRQRYQRYVRGESPTA